MSDRQFLYEGLVIVDAWSLIGVRYTCLHEKVNNSRICETMMVIKLEKLQDQRYCC